MKHKLFSILILILTTSIMSCNKNITNAKVPEPQPIAISQTAKGGSYALPPIVIYKTFNDYRNNVPVAMNASKTEIVSYPDPADITENSRPTELMYGYLLDNRGIGENVAFTSYTYGEYSKLPKAPSLEELKSRIIDKNPLSELYICGGNHGEATMEKCNEIIKSGFKGCKVVIPFETPVINNH